MPGDGEHYTVAFLDRNWTVEDDVRRFDTHVLSSETQAWSSSEASLVHLSDSDKRLCAGHTLSKQIAAGASSLGWIDIERGILLLRDLFDFDRHPAITLIPFPVPSVGFADEDGHYCAPSISATISSS